METILLLIALQQGLFAVGWWLAAWRLELSKPAAMHWVVATLATALALAGFVQRGVWPDFFTYVLANVLALLGFLAMRRGVQVFLGIARSDLESGVLLASQAVVLLLFYNDRASYARLAVVGVSVVMCWVLLRTANETYRALRSEGDTATAWVVAAPLAVLGALYGLRVLMGLLHPELAGRPLHETNQFNALLGVAFMTVGLVINLLLAYLVGSRMIRRLHELSIRDPLTGLLNRRALEPLVEDEAERLRRHGDCYALLLLDIDHFKSINDRFGHAAGDAALQAMAAVLGTSVREVDRVARIGGEEFCVLMPRTELDGALRLAERVRDTLARSALPAPIDRRVTVSVGVALAADAAELSSEVLRRADRALYRAKSDGRDRTVAAEGFIAATVLRST